MWTALAYPTDGPEASRQAGDIIPTRADGCMEIRELKRELERVKRERDILGKATAELSARDPRNG
ncbi:MAG: hypothetical protein GY745_19315 [Actinomycetia bacterium]|nr:hypothetical protein [Actinomycetes bacterium]